MTAPSARGMIGTPAFTDVEHPSRETTTSIDTAPLAPAVYSMFRVPCPESSDPFVTVHEYVAPAPASETDAKLCGPFANTPLPAEIAALGGSWSVTTS